MKSLDSSPARLPRHSTAKAGAFALLIFLSLARPLYAQVGNENPTGHSGIFNGNLENTGVDAWTANATRSITDISVAGAVGEYPLALVRTANSRAPSTTEVFSWSGGWNHSYNWILEDSPNGNTQNFQPSSYTVDFPDGRAEKFQSVGWDAANYYRVRATGGGSAGVRERFVPLDTNPNHTLTYLHAYLILSDGGKVEFKASQYVTGSHYYYKYHVIAIYDPYGLKTTIASEVVGPHNLRRITQVTEPAGRYLRFSYPGNSNSPRIASVTASDGRVVQYYYACCNNWALDHVVYYNNANWTARYQYTNSNIGDPDNNPPLLKTCDDPMYAGRMKRIAYEYKTGDNPDNSHPVYGQVYRVRYWDGTQGHENNGPIVSTLTVGSPNNNRVYRTETRGDGATRIFIYNGAGAGYLSWASDFTDRYASQTYDSYKYINSVTDRNGNRTDYTLNALTGNVTVVTCPLTQGDTPGQQTRPSLRYQYGWANCPDQNNRDANNPYYLYSIRDEGNHVTTFTRDANKRVYQITYSDSGYERFPNYNSFNQVLTHLMVTGGTETFTYDGRGLKQTYRNPDNPSGNPTARYRYDVRDRLTDVTDVLGSVVGDGNHSTSYAHNDRGQVTVTTLPKDINNGNTRHTITNAYNPDGTLQYRTDELGAYAGDPAHTTNYTYDDYRRLKSETPPGRGDGTGANTTYFYYGASPSDNVNDYKFTDSNATWLVLPSGKKTTTVYDDNRRKRSVTVGYQTGDDATTSYTYDWVGNLRTIMKPLNHNNTTIDHDERNRPSAIHVLSQVTTFTYDTAGRKQKVTRPNGQTISYDTFDVMNRVTQQTVTQNLDPDAITKYTYYAPGEGQPVGLLKTFKDPRLVTLNNGEQHTYEYDLMGRKKKITYPKDSTNTRRTEQWSYDTSGRLQTFTNRAGNTQTFSYDALNRMTGFSWNDGLTPSVTFGYDAASRVTNINNANASIARGYWNDNLLGAETEQITGGNSKSVIYFYDDDGNRRQIYYPDGGLTFVYSYTGRNQLAAVNSWATYEYDARGNLTTRTLNNGTHTDYPYYDVLDRVGWIVHYFNGTSRSFNYEYDDQSNNLKWLRRLGTAQGDIGDTFAYDLADQVSGVQLNVAIPQSSPPPGRTILYDSNGNRTTFRPYGPTDTYTTNNLNQYTQRNAASAAYDVNGNLTTGFDASTYQYDAQNRVLSASKPGGPTMTFKYDGLNRQASRSVTGQPTTYNVWDGWDLIEEYQNGGTMTAAYLYGAGGLIAGTTNGQLNYYYQDDSGSTSHLADVNGNLLEWYRYDLQGTPVFYNDADTQIPSSSFGVRHLFTGQQWYSDIGLYDLRNRLYSPDIGRFLQPDPIGFRGDRTNLYRYCSNNPVTRWDPFGLAGAPTDVDGGGGPPGYAEVERVWVEGEPIIREILVGLPGFGSPGGFVPTMGSDNPRDHRGYNPFPRPPEDDQPSVQHPPPSSVPPQNPPAPSIDPSHPATTAEFIIAGNMIEHGNTMDTTPAISPIDLLSGGIAGLARSSIRSVAAESTVAQRAFWVGADGELAAQASGARLLQPSQAALTAAKAGDWSLMRAESAQWAEGATGDVPVFFGNGKGRIFLNDELPELLKNMDAGKIKSLDISF